MPPRFVHLRLHSEFSIVDGLARIDAAVDAAATDGQGALALSDSSSLFGAVRFYKAARSRGVKPILGCDTWIANGTEPERPHRLLLLIQDRVGYVNLCRILSRAWIENATRGRAEVQLEWFAGDGAAGLIALSGAGDGEIGSLLRSGATEAARRAAQALARLFPNRFYLELQRAGRADDEGDCRATLNLAGELDLPVVATHPIQFIDRGDFRAHEARVCIAEGHTLADPRRPRRFTEEQYFKSQAEMEALFADVPVALENAVGIARRCSLQLDLGRALLPEFPTPAGIGIDAHCRDLAAVGLEQRLYALYPEAADRGARRPTYLDRLDLELATIAKMGFSGYFLIVADFINWAKRHDVPVGPGRGSGAGSLVAYSLGITDLDPLRYDLLFERFLNPERVSMPDFDIDFCQDNRDRVIDYVKDKYGADAVAQIATFGTLGAKAVVRDVGRVLDLPYTKCDQLSKLIPHNPADPWTLDRALSEEPAFAEAIAADEEAAQLIELARPLEGLTRNVGMHAGGVLIAPGKLTDFCPLYCAPGTDAVVSQFDKDDIEAIGLVKFDFLGLTTLTVLELATRYVRQLDPSSTLQLDAIPLDDADVYRIFQGGSTTAIFQFESRGMRDLLKRARPDRFDDLIALNALYRPGPMDLIPEFCDRKHGRQRVEYLDPRLQPILGPTYGIMIYQEQVMRIAQTIGGYSLGGADLLRRAMGKKKPEEMAKHRGIFVEGAGRNGVAEHLAAELFDLMEKFAGYGFNKSHSAAYALVAYQTAYLKVHHPAAFAAANLSAVMGDTDKVQEFVGDAKAHRLTIGPPDINRCVHRFVPFDAATIRYGLGAIKGTGQAAIEAIVAERERAGAFVDLFEFCRRIDRRQVNRRVVEALVRAGCFDELESDRARLLASVGRALEQAERAAASVGQGSLFDGDGTAGAAPPEYVAAQPWSTRERLTNEKAALGYYFSGHLFREFETEARRLAPMRLADLKQARDTIKLAGIIVGTRMQNTRRGRMCALVLDDGSAQLEVAVFGELLDQQRAMLKEDTLVFVVGRARFDEFAQRVSITADQIMDLAEARARAQAALRIEVETEAGGFPDVGRLRASLAAYRVGAVDSARDAIRGAGPPRRYGPDNGNRGGAGQHAAAQPAGASGCRVVLAYRNPAAAATIVLPDAWRVRPDDRLLEDLRAHPRVRAVDIQYA
jgi:DNA polymerase-3 subunit alpha